MAIASTSAALRVWLLGVSAVFIGLAAAQEPAPVEPSFGNIQIIRNPRETVIVISGVTPLDKQSGSMVRSDLAGQMKQALENLRRTAIRAGVLPAQIVAITVFTTEAAQAEALRKLPRDAYLDWDPVTAVESRQLTTAGALVELEAVAIAREAKAR